MNRRHALIGLVLLFSLMAVASFSLLGMNATAAGLPGSPLVDVAYARGQQAPTAPPYYARGDFNSWGTTDQLYDDGTHGDSASGDGIYTTVITPATAGRYEWKAADSGWTESWPSSNAWLETTNPSQTVTVTLDTNANGDGWTPDQHIVNAQDGVTSWTAVGDWQGWDNGNPSTTMVSLGGGMYAYTTTISTAGSHQYKAVRSGSWDAVGQDGAGGGRSVNTSNMDFTTSFDNQTVVFWLNANTGRIRVVMLELVINEFVPKGTEWVELYNPTVITITLTNWYLDDADCGSGTSFIGAVNLAPGGYFVVTAGDAGDNFSLSNSGDVVVLCDDTNAEIDRVGYGNAGGAPLAISGYAAARTPNGTDTGDDASDWNIDQTPTSGSVNDAPAVALGSSLILNEFDNYPASGNDKVEIYNPTTGTITLTGWLLSDGDAVASIVTAVSVPAGGWLVLEETVDWTTTMDFSSADVGYLFLPDGTRVDQIGWTGEFEDDTFQRIPDGAGTSDGYDWTSSGGGSTLFDMPDTLGLTNVPDPALAITKPAPALIGVGELLEYTIWVTNNAPGSTATSLVITDAIPVSTTYAYGGDVFANGIVTFTTPSSVTWGSPISVTLGVTVTANFGDQIVNNSYGVYASEAPTPTMGAAVTTTVSAMDLIVDKQGDSAGFPGEDIVYSISIDNLGVVTAANVIVTDTLPVSTTFSAQSSNALTVTVISNTVVWKFGDLISGTVETISLTATVNVSATAGVTLTNYVEASTDTAGDNSGNNNAQWDTAIYKIVPIATSRAGSDGDIFAVEGQVIYTPGTFNSSGWALQDTSGGIAVFYSSPPSINRDDVVRLVATRGSYRNEEQFASPVLYFANLGAGSAVNPISVTTGAVLSGTTEGWLVQIDGYISNLGSCSGSYSFDVDDGSGPVMVYVDSDTNIDICSSGAADSMFISVTGFSTQFDNDFEVKPRDPNDVQLIVGAPLIDKNAPALVLFGDLYTYTITVQNLLGYDLAGVVITDVVPSSAAFAYALDGGSESGGVVTWNVGALSDQTSVSVRFAVTATSVVTLTTNVTYAVSASNYATTTFGAPVSTAVYSSTQLAIHDIQGAAHLSPVDGADVTSVHGIVTAVDSDGFYMQDPNPDSDTATSEGIFVFTSSLPSVSVGDEVLVDGTVSEYYPGGSGTGNLPTTELINPAVVVSSTGNALPAPIVIGNGGRVPPNQVIDDDGNTAFEPTTDGLDFYESLEGMLVQINDAIVVGSNRFGEITVMGDLGANGDLVTPRGGIVVQQNDFNPERVILDDGIYSSEPDVNVGDMFTTPITGVVSYSFGSFKILNPFALPPVVSGGLVSETTTLSGDADSLLVATMNVENLDPNSGDGDDDTAKFAGLADEIVNYLDSPDIIGLQEIQDGSGSTDDGIVTATKTYTTLIEAITNIGGPVYEYREVAPQDGQDGGQPGSNIRVGFLFRPDRVTFVDRSGATATLTTTVSLGTTGVELSYSPGRIAPQDAAFDDSRKPLVGEFIFNNQKVFVVVAHFNSKSGDDPLFGMTQPPVLGSETQRLQQAQAVNDFVDSILALDSNANVIVLGDLNDFHFSPPLDTLKGGVLYNLVDTLPAEEQYTYIYDGNSQTLDHILVSQNLSDTLSGFDIVHLNAEFDTDFRSTDHDPLVALLYLPPLDVSFTSNSPVSVGETSIFTSAVNQTGVQYGWDFGDGITSTGANPTHVYTSTGTYTVTLTASTPLDSVTVTGTHTVQLWKIYLPIIRHEDATSAALKSPIAFPGAPGVVLVVAGVLGLFAFRWRAKLD